MDRNGVLVAVILIVLVGRGSPSQFGDILRVLASAGEQNGKQTEKDDSPSPSPTPIVKEDKPVKSSAKDVPKLDQNGKLPQLKNSPNSEPKSLDGASPGGSGNGGDGEKKKSIDAPTTHEDSQVNVKGHGECDAFANRCRNQHLIACLQPGSGSGQLYLVVINEGEDYLIVTIRAPPTVKLGAEKIELPKNHFRKVNVSSNAQDSSEIVLDTNNGRCTLHTNPPVSVGNFFQNLPSYATRMTPIYGAYVLFITVLIVGGMWACCKFGKRGRQGDGGVPYQELEMGLPQSSTTIDMDTTDGWDQGWDDDWEEKQMAKASEIRPVGSVSANGLTSRSPRREGWEDDWDD